MKHINKTLKKYDNFCDTFEYGYIGLPKGFQGNDKEEFINIKTFLKRYGKSNIKTTYPVLFYMHGSAGLAYGKKYKDAVLKEGFIFFAPNSYKLKNRPTYQTPTKTKNYEAVHKVRVAEIFYNIQELLQFDCINKAQIFLMGSSEGALAAAKYRGKEFKGRIVAAYACENGYYSKDFSIGARKKDPFLNIIGTHDEYFSAKTKYDNNNTGHCANALLEFKNAKVVLLPKTKHNVIENTYTIPEVIQFLKLWTT